MDLWETDAPAHTLNGTVDGSSGTNGTVRDYEEFKFLTFVRWRPEGLLRVWRCPGAGAVLLRAAGRWALPRSSRGDRTVQNSEAIAPSKGRALLARTPGPKQVLATISKHDPSIPLFYNYDFHIVHEPLGG